MSDAEPPLFGFEWNQFEEFPDEARDVVVAIICLNQQGEPTQIGSGFFVRSEGSRALIVTAAHVITEGVRAFQNSRRRIRAHSTTPSDFLAPEVVSAASSDLRVIVTNGHRADLCLVAHIAWDEASDLAVLAIVPSDDSVIDLFDSRLDVAESDPRVGDIIGVIGYAEFETNRDEGDISKGILRRRMLIRIGKALEVHQGGFMRVTVPCVEGSMPTFSGMSGGAAFVLPALGENFRVFGLLSRSDGSSSNPSDPDPASWDRSKNTRRSIFASLRRTVVPTGDGGQLVTLGFTFSGTAINTEVDQARVANLAAWQPST
ncbi:hypothetical protein ABIB58_001639 [Brevundimonas sp. UYEF29]|uniref:S1 family peptidase n=1 Tax=Brevundimonas sp. UYEF29 TaxID=3156346 RepID=UPI00339A60FA